MPLAVRHGVVRSCRWQCGMALSASNTVCVVMDSTDVLLMRLSGLVSQRIEEDVCE
jgi:hypothetical protein